MAPSNNIIQLRQLLAERFPHVRQQAGPPPAGAGQTWPTAWPPLDVALHGGLPQGALTELVAPPGSSGSASLLHGLIHQGRARRDWMALVDGADSLDATGLGDAVLDRFLWVRCQKASEAMQALDLLARDGNLAVLLLDLRLNPAAQLRKIPATAWYRLQRILEHRATALFAITPQPLIVCAHTRLTLVGRYSLAALDQSRESFLPQLQLRVEREPAELESIASGT